MTLRTPGVAGRRRRAAPAGCDLCPSAVSVMRVRTLRGTWRRACTRCALQHLPVAPDAARRALRAPPDARRAVHAALCATETALERCSRSGCTTQTVLLQAALDILRSAEETTQ